MYYIYCKIHNRVNHTIAGQEIDERKVWAPQGKGAS